MKRPYNILIFPAGEINAVELHTALSAQVNLRVFGASSVDRHGSFIFRKYRGGLPNIHDQGFIESLNSLIREWEIDILIPSHDSVVEYLSRHRNSVSCAVLSPDARTSEICRDKKLTYNLFSDCSFIPKTYEASYNIESYPVFAKPRIGQGSIGARKIISIEALESSVDWEAEIVSEYLPGREVTVDCLTTKTGQLIGIFPRTRDRTMAGISVAGDALQADDQLSGMASVINDRLAFLGMWYFQAKMSRDGIWKLLEISARSSGSQCLTRARGVNLPLLSVYTAMGHDVQVSENPYHVRMDRTLTNRYQIDYSFQRVYLDYDDTVIQGQEVNPNIIRLVYQFRNDAKEIILITKHAGDLKKSLKDHALSEALFSRIIHLRQDEEKVNRIDPTDAIFIDNAFSERQAVLSKFNIPVFDVDTVEVLQKWIA